MRNRIRQFCRLDFPEERKQLLEVVGPELQSIYDDMGIEVSAKQSHLLRSNMLIKIRLARVLRPVQVLLVDMQYGSGGDPDVDPHLAEYFLEEISSSHLHSRGCFLLVSNITTFTVTSIERYVYLSLPRGIKNYMRQFPARICSR